MVDGTFNVAATNNYYGLFMESYGGEPGLDHRTLHGALNLALDDPGYAMITDDGGSPTITVDSGGTLAKTGGTGISTIEGVQVTASGNPFVPDGDPRPQWCDPRRQPDRCRERGPDRFDHP